LMGVKEHDLGQLDSLFCNIHSVLQHARNNAYQAINFTMVQAYWQIGYLIMEHEQKGKERAEYGKAVLSDLSARLTKEFGKGFDASNLRYMRQFYLKFPKCDALSHESMENSYSLRQEL